MKSDDKNTMASNYNKWKQMVIFEHTESDSCKFIYYD